MKTFKYRIYPNNTQIESLNNLLDAVMTESSHTVRFAVKES